MDLELYIERIEQYETGQMPALERAAFEAELTTNDELRQALDLFRQANDVVEQRVENSVREQFRQWDAAAVETPMTVTTPTSGKVVAMRTTWIRLAIAASVALLLGWFGFRWVSSQYSDEALFAAQYEFPVNSATRSASNDERPLQPGFEAWAAGDLKKAATFFRDIPSEDEYYAEAQYYLGHVALQQQQYDAAIAAFTQTAQRPPSKFREKAEWNRVLAYLVAGHTADPAFQSFLQRIADNSAHSYQAQAKDLQKKLQSKWR